MALTDEQWAEIVAALDAAEEEYDAVREQRDQEFCVGMQEHEDSREESRQLWDRVHVALSALRPWPKEAR